jgi:hypothetical protein
MSDRFSRDPRQPLPRGDDRELARRVREQMRTAVSKVRAGPSAATGDAPQDAAAEHEPGDDVLDESPG